MRARRPPPAPVAAPAAGRKTLSRGVAGFALASLILLAPGVLAAQEPARRCGQGAMRADIDGDGSADRVLLAGHWIKGHGCRFTLSATTRNHTYRLRLREGLLSAPRVSPEARIASLYGAALIDPHPGAEILVTLDRGASSSGVGVYARRGSRLVFLSKGSGGYGNGLFWKAQAGLVGNVSDCWRRRASGEVISSSYEVDGELGSRTVVRRLYRLSGSRFRLAWTRSYSRTPTRRFPEFSGRYGLFDSCMAQLASSP